MSFYAFEVASGQLEVFESEAAILAFVAAVDSEVLLFAADGSGLQCVRMADGQRFLRPWASCSSCKLQQIFSLVTGVRGIASLEEVRRRFADDT